MPYSGEKMETLKIIIALTIILLAWKIGYNDGFSESKAVSTQKMPR